MPSEEQVYVVMSEVMEVHIIFQGLDYVLNRNVSYTFGVKKFECI
jgi:hypothetical protein